MLLLSLSLSVSLAGIRLPFVEPLLLEAQIFGRYRSIIRVYLCASHCARWVFSMTSGVVTYLHAQAARRGHVKSTRMQDARVRVRRFVSKGRRSARRCPVTHGIDSVKMISIRDGG
jgi:hypothetical protein